MMNYWHEHGFRLTHKATGLSVVYRTRTAIPKPADMDTARRWLWSLVEHARRPNAKPIKRSYVLDPEPAARVPQGPEWYGQDRIVTGRDNVLAVLSGRIPGPKS